MSRWRESAVKLGAGLAVAALFLLVLEGALRLLPLGRWEGDRPSTSYPLFVPGEGELSDQYVTNPHYAKTMSNQRFARVKPSGVKRVFILGGSAALGWPGPNPSAFTGYLQRALNQVAPGRFEIINAAAMSYGSHRVLDLLTDVVRLEPDLIVIWSGNNEYVEHNTLSRFARTETMGSVQRVLRHSSLYRSVRLTLGAVAPSLFIRPEGDDLTDLRRTPQVRRGMLGRSAETDRQVLESYRANLRAMARLIRESGAGGAFCTVPVNLADWVPNNLTEWDPARLPAEVTAPHTTGQWLALSNEAAALGEQGRYAEAAAVLERLLQMTPQYALGHYLLGVSYLQLKRIPEATAAFGRARDLDPRPIRALLVFEQTIREVAASEGMTLIDLEGAFAAASRSGVPGLDLFLDYVHPNEVGHKLAAATVLKEVTRLLDPQLPLAQMETFIAGDDWVTQQNYSQSANFYTLGMSRYNNGDLDGAEQAYLRTLEEDPKFSAAAGNLGVIYETRGDLPAARQFYEQAVRLDAGTFHAANLARVLYLLGDRQGARELGERLLRQGVDDVRLLFMLGDLAYAEERFEAALEFYRKARDAGSDDPGLLAKIEESRLRLGKQVAPRSDGSAAPP